MYCCVKYLQVHSKGIAYERKSVYCSTTNMWKPPPQLYHMSPPMRNNQNDFRQDSTICKACSRHLFRTEAFHCHGKCNGEFHAECSVRQDWTCGKCKQEKSITKEELDKLTSAVDDIGKNLAKTDAKITRFRVETEASKISDNIEISELKTQMQNMHIRFDFMEKHMKALKAMMSTAMTELKTTVSDLESKIVVSNAQQTKSDQIDISGVQETLNNASHVIITEMCKTLDFLLEEKSRLQKTASTQPEQQQQITSKLEIKQCLPEEENHALRLDDHSQFTEQKQQHPQQRSLGGEESLRKWPPQQHPKNTRLQQLAEQFQLQ